MLSRQEEALCFLREFEKCSQEYLAAQGIGEHEIANAHLELQWKFLHAILRQKTSVPEHFVKTSKVRKTTRIFMKNSTKKNPRTTIA